MRNSFVSEMLVLAGSYFCANSNLPLGMVMIALGCLGGLTAFLYFVSVKQTSENRKSQIHSEIKELLLNLGKALYETNVITIAEAKKDRDKTVH